MIAFTVNGLRTPNPLNGTHGHWARKAKLRKTQRATLTAHTLAARPPALPLVVTVTRIAPSSGLDPHDGLGAALKGAIDGIADALGVDDRDERVSWRLCQRRGPWAVQVAFSPISRAGEVSLDDDAF